MREQRRLEHQRDQRNDGSLDGREQQHDAGQLADVEGRPVDRRHQQRADCLALPLALERPAERQRAGERNGDPQDSRGRALDCPAFLDEAEREDQDARDGEEQRREDDLAAPRLDEEILPRHEPCRAHERGHGCFASGRPCLWSSAVDAAAASR